MTSFRGKTESENYARPVARRRRVKNTTAPNSKASPPRAHVPIAGTGGVWRTSVTSVAESLDELESLEVAETLAVLVMAPNTLGAVTAMVKATFALLASEAAVQVTVPPSGSPVCEHAAESETQATVAGSVSVTVIDVAAPGPLFVTVSV